VGLEGTTKDEMVGWQHRFNGHEFEQALGDVISFPKTNVIKSFCSMGGGDGN